ncbi:reverse transcriptase domain-containing protein [Tanacetum coccineum]
MYGNLPREGPKPFAIRPSMKLGLSKTWQSLKHPKNSLILSNPDRAYISIISGAIHGGEMTPPLGFSTLPLIPNVNTNERPLITTTVFAATTPGNTPFAYRASTSTDYTPMISPAFVVAIYEILESLLRDRQRQIHNEDLRTKLEYFSEDYDEEREMEPRLEQTREVTPPPRTRSPRVHRQCERLVGFEEAPNMEGYRTERNTEDLPSTYKGLMEKTYTWIEAREVATNGASNDQRDNFKSLSKSLREILATEKVARSFEQPPRILGSRRSRDMSKYKQSLPQRLLPSAQDRLKGKVPLGILHKVLPRRLQRLPSDPNGRFIREMALMKPKKSRRVAKYAIKLGEHDIMFQARGDSNKEMPKDFLIEAPPEDNRKEVGRKKNTKLEETKPSCEWKVYTDGASSFDGSSAGLMLIDPEGKEYTYALRFELETMNNEANYKALLAGLRIAQEMEIINLAIFVDSQLLVNQIKGIYVTKQPAIREYLQRTKETLRRRLIEEKEVLKVKTKEEESWITPIHEYLLSGLLPENFKESKRIRIKVPQYKLIRGSCGFNTEPRSMVVKIIKQGYYWPSMHRDVARIIQDYERYKEQFTVRKRAEIRAIAAGNTWPFSHWGVSILRPLPTAPGGLKSLAKSIEHSTK